MRISWYFDIYQWEHRVVRLRNALAFVLQGKDRRDRPKIFVVGHPRTGTKSIHRLFRENGLSSFHGSGNWLTRHYDCFSDRGNFQPYLWMEKAYPNSTFILNTRPVYNYIRSVIKHRFGRGEKSSGWFEPSVTNIQNEIIERNRDFMKFVRNFRGKSNFLVVNIEREGALSFLAERLGLEPGENANRPRKAWRDQDLEKIEQAFSGLGLEERKDEPLVLEELLGEEDRRLYRDFLGAHTQAVFL